MAFRIIINVAFYLISGFSFGQFAPEQQYLNEYIDYPYDAIGCDINNDGIEDVISISKVDSTIAWNLNIGAGVFGPLQKLQFSMTDLVDLDTADIDGDGFVDAIVASAFDSKIAWFKNNGSGGFDAPQYVQNQLGPISAVKSCDIDNDGKIDIVALSAGNVGQLVWFPNLGSGVFGSQIAVSSNINANDFAVKDFDNDGDGDLVITNFGSDNVVYYENTLGTSFGVPDTLSNSVNGAQKIGIGDLNGDGFSDIIVCALLDNEVIWHKNLGNSSFSIKKVLGSTLGVVDYVTMDYDSDGDNDLLLTATNGALYRYDNLTDTTFAPFQLVVSMSVNRSLRSADIDSDGLTDLIISNTYLPSNNKMVGWLKNLGGGNFSYPEQIVSDVRAPITGFEADINNDGLLDVVISSLGTKIVYLLNEGSGSFAKASIITDQIVGAYAIAPGDVDNDGDIDIVSIDDINDEVMWFENVGGVFGPPTIIANTSDHPTDVICVDLDNDGWNDVVATSREDDKVAWFKNNGATFASEAIISTSLNEALSLCAFDWDMDGDNDLLAGGDTHLEFYENVGLGSFSAPIVLSSTMNWVSSIEVGNVTSDSILDVVATSRFNSTIFLFKNLLTSFSSPIVVNDNTTGVTDLTLVDIDLDGDDDIFSVSFTTDRTYKYENYNFGNSFDQFTMPGVVYAGLYVRKMDIDLDGDMDIYSPSRGEGSMIWYENYHLSTNQLRGKIYVDLDSNAVYNSIDYGVQNIPLIVSPQADYSYTYQNGDYFINLDSTYTGSYLVSPDLPPYWGISTDSLFYTVSSIPTFIDSLDFGVFPDTNVTVVDVNLIQTNSNCNVLASYVIDVYNPGTNIADGIVCLELDDSLTFVSSSSVYDSIVGGMIYWHFDSLNYFEHIQISVEVINPDFLSIGEILISSVSVDASDSSNLSYFFTSDTLSTLVTCAYDPNDKRVSPAGIGDLGYIDTTVSTFEYTIRFQNTGTDTATNVLIQDQLDQKLDWGTLVPLAASHPYSFDINPEGLASFDFSEIFLPDSNANELLSHGFIRYKIETIGNLIEGDQITNSAEIYFDFNPAVITDTAINTVYECALSFDNLNIPNFACTGDSIVSDDPLVPTSYTWTVNSIASGDSSYFEWVPDISGNNILNIHASSQFCEVDTVLNVLVSSAYESPVDSLTICSGDSIQVYGNYVQLGGLYQELLSSVSGCDSLLNTFVEVIPLPMITFNSTIPDTICINFSPIALSNSTPSGGVYSGTGVVSGEFSPSLAGIGAHQLYYQYTDSLGCVGLDSITIYVDGCLGVEGLLSNHLRISPNPVRSNLFITCAQCETEFVEIIDVTGQVIKSVRFSEIIDVSDINTGEYLVKVYTTQGVLVDRFFKSH